MAYEYDREHSETKPERIKVTDTLYKGGRAFVTYEYRWDIEQVEDGYLYFVRVINTSFNPANGSLAEVVAKIKSEYYDFIAAWNAGRQQRETVESWIGHVILD